MFGGSFCQIAFAKKKQSSQISQQQWTTNPMEMTFCHTATEKMMDDSTPQHFMQLNTKRLES